MGRQVLLPALASEGQSDDWFLTGVLERLLDTICLEEFDDVVDIQTPFPIRNRKRPATIKDIIDWTEKEGLGYNLIFFHRDQGLNQKKAQEEWISPIQSAWEKLNTPPSLVCVVPVVETEAWCLADGKALRDSLGITWTDSQLGIPKRIGDIEKIRDPKKVLSHISARINRSIVDYFETLGRRVSLDCLAQVPSFRALRQETKAALLELGFRERRAQ